TFSVTTPNSNDVLTIDSPGAGQNRLGGTSGGVAFSPLTFFNVTTFLLQAGANDGGLPNDSVTVGAAGLGASGLQYFVVSTGTGDDLFEIDSPNYALPAAGGGVVFQAGSGGDTFVGNADTGYTLADSGVTSAADGGTVGFTSVENASLTGGA